MNGTMYRHKTRMFTAKPRNARRCAMRGTVVHDPENTPGFLVRSLVHNLVDESIEWRNPAFSIATAKQLRSMDIEGGQIGPSPAAFVFVFDLHRRSRPGRKRSVFSTTGLNARFLVGRYNELIIFELSTFPGPFVKIENSPCLLSKVGISWKDPATMLPWTNRILAEPAPDCCAADRCSHSTLSHRVGEIPGAPSRERHSKGRWQFAGERLNLHDHVWGGKPGDDPGGGAPPGRKAGFHKTFSAITTRPLVAFGGDERFHHYRFHRRPTRSFERVAPDNMATYISELWKRALAFRRTTRLCEMGCVVALWSAPLPTRMPRLSSGFNSIIR